jgi:hypothetical protein
MTKSMGKEYIGGHLGAFTKVNISMILGMDKEKCNGLMDHTIKDHG